MKERLPSNAPKDAALVAKVFPSGPASKAGYARATSSPASTTKPVEGSRDVIDYVSTKPIGSRVTLAYYRDGKPGTLQVTLGELPADDGPNQQGIGVGLQDITPEISRFLNVPQGTRGALVTEVVPGSRAARAGLQPEDVILEVNRKPVSSATEATTALEANRGGEQILRIRRGGSTRFVTVPKE